MTYYLYVLKSKKVSRFYIGSTANIEQRLGQHNAGSVRSTKGYRPWKIVYKEIFADKKEARKREMHLKKNYQARKEIFIMVPSSNG